MRTRRRARRQWVFVVVLLVIGVAAAAIRAHITAARRGYSDTRGATVVHYTLPSRLLGRSLSEIGVVPAGGGRRPLLVLLHGRHDPSPVSWLIPCHRALRTTGALGGYHWGLPVKRAMLAWESARFEAGSGPQEPARGAA